MDNKKIEAAKKLLEKNGYYTESLWHIRDVQSLFKASNEQAMDVLKNVFNSNSSLMDDIWNTINAEAGKLGLEEVE